MVSWIYVHCCDYFEFSNQRILLSEELYPDSVDVLKKKEETTEKESSSNHRIR
jgi:hypothetical protein